MDSLPEKICTKCGVLKPKTIQFFHKHLGCKDGLEPKCKVCKAAEQKIYRVVNREKISNYHKARREANREKLNANSRAYYQVNIEKEKERKKIYRQANPEKMSAGQKAWREQNPEKHSAINKAYYEANREKSNAQTKAYYEANREKVAKRQKAYRELNPEREVARSKAHYASNPEMYRARDRNRRALAKASKGTHTAVDVAKQFAAQGGKCYWCGCSLKKSGKDKFHADHREPLSKGGSNGPDNIVISCPSCNQSKGAKSPLEFAGRLF